MSDPIRHLLTIVLLGLALGCSRSAPEEPGAAKPDLAASEAPIQTDRAEYTLRYTEQLAEATIGVRYTNRTGSPVYLPTCHVPHPPVLEKRVGSTWVAAYRPAVLACLGPPVVIQPGATYEYTFKVVAGRPGTNSFPQFEVAEIPGTYRLVWGLLSTWDPDGPGPGLGRSLPLEQRVSNEFRIGE
jgi:hypothetical protein